MKRAAVALTLVAAAFASSALAGPPPAPKPAEIYHARCEKCHGPDGRAPQKGEGMSFADGEWNRGPDLKAIAASITDGVPDTAMLAFKDKLSVQEIEALAKYVRSLDKSLK